MKNFPTLCACLLTLTTLSTSAFAAPSKLGPVRISANQTATLSPVYPQTTLPFQVVIETAFQMPMGFQSGAVGVYKGFWVFIAGRTNGLHGFEPTDNFPPDSQNTSIFVINSATGQVFSRSLYDPSSGLTQQQIDTLSVTSPQSYQEDNTLIMVGGYGVDTASGAFDTKPVLTVINLPGIISWVMQPGKNVSVAQNIRQVYNSIFQITGGEMFKLGNTMQLIFGQNFTGQYTSNSDGDYSDQVRRFQITNNRGQLGVTILSSMPSIPDPNFRRRDLNIVPTLLNNNGTLQYGLVAYSGVFTLTGGVWTVPVIINGTSDPSMADPESPSAFKQAMNQYACAKISFYSRKSASSYHILFGGISYGFFSNGTFQTDNEIPFINQVTTIQMDQNGNFTQYLMDNEYPVIPSTGPHPGNTLRFGAGAYFMPTSMPQFANKVFNLDSIRQPTVIGYIVGGIQSTLPNTNVISDSSASPYVFKVTLIPNTSRALLVRSSKAKVSDSAKSKAVPVALASTHSKQTYNRKYPESSSQPTPPPHHSA